MKRTELIEVTGGKATHLKIETYYLKGGMNYFSGQTEKRGIYFSVCPVTRSEFSGGGFTESYSAFSGTKIHLKEMSRFNQKAFDEFKVDESTRAKLIYLVLQKNGLELKKSEE